MLAAEEYMYIIVTRLCDGGSYRYGIVHDVT